MAQKYLDQGLKRYPSSSKLKQLQKELIKSEINNYITKISTFLNKSYIVEAENEYSILEKKYPNEYSLLLIQKELIKENDIDLRIKKINYHLKQNQFSLAKTALNKALIDYPGNQKLKIWDGELANYQSTKAKNELMELVNNGRSDNEILRKSNEILRQFPSIIEAQVYKKLIVNGASYKKGWTKWFSIHNKNGESISIRYNIPNNSISSNQRIKCEYKSSGISNPKRKAVSWSLDYIDYNGRIRTVNKEVNFSEFNSNPIDFIIEGIGITQHAYNSVFKANEIAFAYKKLDNSYTNGPKVFDLYNKGRLKIKVIFTLKEEYCGKHKNSKFKYEISGIDPTHMYKKLYWSIKHETCNGNVITTTYTFNLKDGIGSTIVENSADFQIKGFKILKKPYDIKIQ